VHSSTGLQAGRGLYTKSGIAAREGLGGARKRHSIRGLLDHGYGEIPVTGQHAVAIESLPPLHEDPFDRILVAQPLVEGIMLLTADPMVARDPAPVRRV